MLELFDKRAISELQHAQKLAGELTFGGIDHNKYTGKLHPVPVTEPGWWQIGVDDIGAGVEGEIAPFQRGSSRKKWYS